MNGLRLAMACVVMSAGTAWADDVPAETTGEGAVVVAPAPASDAEGLPTAARTGRSACAGIACSDRVSLRLGRGGDLMLTGFLSLQPTPIDFGNFYAGNWRTAIVMTGLEASLAAAGSVILISNVVGMESRSTDSFRDEWTARERNQMIGLAGGYLVTKLVAAWIAVGTVAQKYDQPTVSLLPAAGPAGGGVQLSLRIP